MAETYRIIVRNDLNYKKYEVQLYVNQRWRIVECFEYLQDAYAKLEKIKESKKPQFAVIHTEII